MLRTLICIALIASGVIARGQDTLATHGNWSLGLSGSLDMSYRTLVKNEDTPIVDGLYEFREDAEVPGLRYSAGVDVIRDLGAHWGLSLGIQYSDRGFRTKENGINFTDNTGATIADATLHYHHKFISFPLMVRYGSAKGKVRFRSALGASLDRLHEQHTVLVIEYPDGSEDEERFSDTFTEYEEWGISTIAEAGICVGLSEQFGLHFALRGRYQVNELVDAPLSAHLYDMGLIVGCQLRL